MNYNRNLVSEGARENYYRAYNPSPLGEGICALTPAMITRVNGRIGRQNRAARFRAQKWRQGRRTIHRVGLTAISQGRGLVGVACPVVTLGGYEAGDEEDGVSKSDASRRGT